MSTVSKWIPTTNLMMLRLDNAARALTQKAKELG